jgi:hypothetical protein
MNKVLLTSVCRPIGPAHGDAPSVGYELLHGQVTRAQGLFSPRSLHLHFSLEYIAENLDAPCVVLQYPSKRELVAELKKGYDFICISFLLAVFHRMKEVVELVREHSPTTKIVLGGYGTVLPDDFLAPWGDHICREEGVEFMRKLLGERELPMPYRHPLVVSRLKIFGIPVSRTGMVFAGLGCPNGCDFCCTSHFFKRKHIKLLPTGKDIFQVVERYLERDEEMSIVVLDEDFLLNKRRALEFRDEVVRSGRTISMFVFASIKAISQFTIEEILEMGIDGFWIGYEGTRSGYAKQQGRDPRELFPELQRHGISILASMIVGMPYQTAEIVDEELEGLLELAPNLSQFLIYGPTPGTPFFEQVKAEGTLRPDLVENPEEFFRSCDGFAAMVKHPVLSAAQIEAQQRHCFDEDFQRNGPSIYRSLRTWLSGYKTLSRSDNPRLRRKAERFATEVRKAYPVFLPGVLLGPNRRVRKNLRLLQREVHATLGKPTVLERLLSFGALVMALRTSILLRFDRFQHPRLTKHAYRLPAESPKAARIWRKLTARHAPLTVEMRQERTVWLRHDGILNGDAAARFAAEVRSALKRTRNRIVLDLERLEELEAETADHLAKALFEYRERIRVLLPELATPSALAALAAFNAYHVTPALPIL